jgi:hypothetical protein
MCSGHAKELDINLGTPKVCLSHNIYKATPQQPPAGGKQAARILDATPAPAHARGAKEAESGCGVAGLQGLVLVRRQELLLRSGARGWDECGHTA